MHEEPLSDEQLDELEALASAASPAPWIAVVGPGIGGDEFIRLGGDDDSQPDMYVWHDREIAPSRDLDFIATARNLVPQLIAEVKRCRARNPRAA